MVPSNNPTLLAEQESRGPLTEPASALADRLNSRTAHVAVLGLGYAGLPMAVELARAGFAVTGLDVDEERVAMVNEGYSPVPDVSHADMMDLSASSRLRASACFDALAEVDCAVICVPTPLNAEKRQDSSYVEAAALSVAKHLHPGMLVILQSTCRPGTTQQIVLPILEASGLKLGEDFFVAFAPERIDPGNKRWTLRNTPKLVGGVTTVCGELAALLFKPIVEPVIVVSSPDVAEMAKLVENTFRFINVSFINEMAILCDRMGIDIWEVVDAAATKPFAFMPHYPGPGVGGHCIPVVPFFLEEVAQGYGMVGGVIEAAGRINEEMPRFVVEKLERLAARKGVPLAEARVLLLGLSYKADVADTRCSPSLTVLQRLAQQGVDVSYYDPYVPTVSFGSVTFRSLTAEELYGGDFSAAVLLTAHAGIDYDRIARQVKLMLDVRNHLPLVVGSSVTRL